MKILGMVLLIQSTFGFVCGTEEQSKSTVMTYDQGRHRIWNESDRYELSYCVSDRFKDLKPKMIRAMELAASDWSAQAGIKFRYDPSADATCDDRNGPETRFRIAINNSRRARYAARAFFPYDERNTVIFKKSYVKKSFEELLRLTRHELGHVLGLRHEHIRYENPNRDRCVEDDNFSDVTPYDSSSIMHYSICGGTGTTELSENDRLGISLLYPISN